MNILKLIINSIGIGLVLGLICGVPTGMAIILLIVLKKKGGIR